MNTYQLVGFIGALVIGAFIFRSFGKDYLIGLMFVVLGLLGCIVVLIVGYAFDFSLGKFLSMGECSLVQILSLSEGLRCGTAPVAGSYGVMLGGALCILLQWADRYFGK